MGNYYSSVEIDENIVCAYCKQQFVDIAKLVPECGESICGHCYEDLKDNVNAASGQFECLACKEMHEMPEKGLGDNKAILKLLTNKIARPLSEQEDNLKRTLESLQSQLNELRLFDGREHVDQHCEMLQVEVFDEIDRLVSHLKEIEEDLLAEIRKYRERSLKTLEENQHEIQKRNAEELTSLSKELDQLGADWIGHFSRIESVVKDSKVNAAFNSASLFESKIKTFKQSLKSEAFNGNIRFFKPAHSFLGLQDPLRKYLKLLDKEPTHRIHSTPFKTLSNPSLLLTRILWLSKDCLLSYSLESNIKVWSIDKDIPIYQFLGHTAEVLAIEALKNGWIATGSGDKTIKIWDLDQKTEIRTLEGHTDSVVALKALKSGNLVSYACDDIIKIWDPYLDEGNLIWTSERNKIVLRKAFFGSLSDERFVTAIHDDTAEEMFELRVWDPIDRTRTSVKISTGLLKSKIQTSLVLLNDQVALGCFDGTIKIVDLFNEAKSILKLKAHSEFVYSFAQFSSGGRLVSAGTNVEQSNAFLPQRIQTISVWNIEAKMQLLQTINTGHSAYLLTLSISPDENILATGCFFDIQIKLWNVDKK